MTGFSRQFLLFSLIPLLMMTSNGTAQNFYPLEARNSWTYRVFYNNYPQPMDSGTTQLGVVGDTLMPNGRTYTRLGRADILGATYVRVDSNYVYYFARYGSYEVRMFNLRGAPGTVDTIGWGPVGRSVVASVTTQQIFGSTRTVRRYYLDGLVQYEVSLADGFGIVDALDKADGVWPFYAWWSIRGCVIRDTVYGTPVSVGEYHGLPTKVNLYQNFPNPFNPSTTFKYDLPEPAKVSLIVYDVLGRKVAELVSKEKPAGYHSITWNAADVASGVYLARFVASDANGYSKYSRVSKLVLMK